MCDYAKITNQQISGQDSSERDPLRKMLSLLNQYFLCVRIISLLYQHSHTQILWESFSHTHTLSTTDTHTHTHSLSTTDTHTHTHTLSLTQPITHAMWILNDGLCIRSAPSASCSPPGLETCGGRRPSPAARWSSRTEILLLRNERENKSKIWRFYQ